MEIYKERVRIAAAVGHVKSAAGNCAHFLQRVNHEVHSQAVNTIYALTPRPSWEKTIAIIKEQASRNETRSMEYQAVMGYKKPTMGLMSNVKSDREPMRLCRHCGKSHWDKDCPGLKPQKPPSRPCKHCQGSHYDDKCPSSRSTSAMKTDVKKGDIKCFVCGESHKVNVCPVVKVAKESIIGKSSKESTETDTKDAVNILQLTKAIANLSTNYGKHEIRQITEFATTNAGVATQSKAMKATTKHTPSLGFMCKACDGVGDVIYLDSCSQEHIIRNKELMEHLDKCDSNISLVGIVEGSTEVASSGYGLALGFPSYYVPGAKSNLISYGKLCRTGYRITTLDDDNVFKVVH